MAAAVVASLFVLGVILVILGPISWLVAGKTVQRLSGKDRADAINTVRQTLLAAIAGATVFASLAYTARTYLLSRRGQVTERFRAAVENLASDKLEVRLGSVYSLEHVLSESAVDHAAVVKVLAGFVRNNTHRGATREPSAFPELRSGLRTAPDWGVELSADIQAAVEALARRPKRNEPRRVDLRHTNLAGLSLRHFEFESPPRLEGMFLTSADLRRADLRGVNMKRTILNNADMCFAWLVNARCDRAALCRVDLRGALLNGTNFFEADLSGADLRETDGLTAKQLAAATIDEETRLPDYLVGDPWVAARLADCRVWAASNQQQRFCAPPTPQP
ncbi:pentapeptide repeat-containing protein [Streptomyces sp. NPDC002758]